MKTFFQSILILAIFLLPTKASAEINDICPGEVISAINNTTSGVSTTINGEVDRNGDSKDYYYFQINVNGTLNYNYSSEQDTDLSISKISCADADNNPLLDDDKSASGTIAVSAGDIFYVRINARSNTNDSYSLALNFSNNQSFQCANPQNFFPVFSQNLYGKLLIAGNTSLCQNVNGTCGNPGTSNNNNINMMHIDYDDIHGTLDHGSTTFNSSAAVLDIPSGKRVLWAGLTWQGYMVNWNDTQKNSGRSIKYKHESDSYQTVLNANMNWVYFDASRMYYQGFVDITSYVNQHGGGYYWVGDLATTLGQPAGGSFGAWSITVVYEDYDEPFKNISVYSGYQAFAGSADINSAATYASNNGCSTNTGVGNNISSTLSGFLTPRQGAVKSSFVLFAGEGDISLHGDSGSITNKAGETQALTNALNDTNNIMNATISKNGVHVTSGLPFFSTNSLGADIDTFDMTGRLSNDQTSTQIRLSTTGDGYMPGLYGLETELFIPRLCYDYAYKQQGNYFTESNDGTQPPKLSIEKLSGGAITGEPVEVSIYVRNQVDSDILVNNLMVNVIDMNTSQVSYIRNTTKRNLANETNPQPIADSLLNVADSYINNIPIGTLGSLEYFYIYYQLNPVISELDMPLNVVVDYDLTVAGSTISYSTKLGVGGIAMCSDTNFNYTPEYGIFNLVHSNYYNTDTGGSDAYYNLPTQVVKREGNFKVIALDVINQDDLNPVSTIVGVELIDAAAFHDTEASCKEPSSAISEKIWINIDDNATSALFDRNAIQNAIGLNNTMTSSTEFYQNARENAAFRITYIVSGDGNDQLVKTLKENGEYKILNFSEIVQTVGACTQPVVYPLNANNTGIATQSAQACGNSGNFISKAHLQACMECIYGQNTKRVCSRDNFAIRPEAFLMQLDDQNQTNPNLQTNITTLAHSGSAAATAPLFNLAAGYQYNIEVNATSHIDNNPAQGYTKTFNLTSADTAEYIWEPAGTLLCNDISNKSINQAGTVRLFNGALETNTSAHQTGKYRFSINDTTWTTVDGNPSYMLHHTGPHFTTTLDCIPNSTNVQSVNDISLNGCNISSNHTNTEANLRYNDYNVLFHPYKFGVTNVLTLGLTSVTPSTQAYIYMADIGQDENMSVHLNTTVTAEGYDSVFLSNFTDQCYSQPVELTIGKTPTLNPLLQYKYRVHNRNINDLTITAHDINQTIDAGDLATNPSFSAAATFFQQDQNGTIDLMTNLNYHRDINTSVNPEDINLTTITALDNATLFSADLKNNAIAEGNVSVDQRILHYYGRTNAPRQIFTAPVGTAASPAQALIYYEVHCDIANGCNKSLLQGGVDANITDDPRWIINIDHTNNFGTAGTINQRGLNIVTTTDATGNHQDFTNLVYDGSRGYPYKATMENNASRWLIYNKYNGNATTNQFEVEFINLNSSWAGVRETNTTTNSNAAPKTNRRVMW